MLYLIGCVILFVSVLTILKLFGDLSTTSELSNQKEETVVVPPTETDLTIPKKTVPDLEH